MHVGERKLEGLRMISVLIPPEVAQELGQLPDSFVGKTIEVDGTPLLVKNAYVNVAIAFASQLRVIR